MPNPPVNSSLDWASLLSPMAGSAVQKPQVQRPARIFPFSRWIPRRACASSEGLTESFQGAEYMKLFSS